MLSDMNFVCIISQMSPEVIKHENYNYKADIWSFGITMLELAFGTTPYTKFKSPMKVCTYM